MSRGEVPTTVLQQAFRDSGLSRAEVARRLGWMIERPDSARVGIRLGLRAYTSAGRRVRSKQADYDTAVNLINAMGLDPVDYGL